VNYTVSDPAGLTAQVPVTITIANLNRAPALTGVEDLQAEEGRVFRQVLPAATDPDQEDAEKSTYELSNLPAGASFNSSSRSLEWTPRYDQAGEYSMVYRVKDAAGETAQVTVSLTVKDVNRAPEIKEVGAKTVKEGQEVSFQVEANDPDEEDQGKVSLSADGMPAGANFNGSTGAFNWVPREDQQGDYQLTITAKDPQGASSQITVRITVEDVPAPSPQ
jgi:hypothetical protein